MSKQLSLVTCGGDGALPPPKAHGAAIRMWLLPSAQTMMLS